jgi:hypothetical protein
VCEREKKNREIHVEREEREREEARRHRGRGKKRKTVWVGDKSVHGAGEERRSVKFGFGTFSPKFTTRP